MRSIDPVLLSKINQQNQTIYNNAQPKMSIQVSRAKTTVSDSTYWTVETIREKAGLGDLSLAARRQKAYGPPNRIYNIYVDNGVVKTAIREYPDYHQEKWKTQFELGNGSAVAIAFDGEWEWWRKKWQLKTYENPWLFWVDGSGKLQAQLWDDTNTKVELASSVVKVKAIRGWKNVNFLDRDQGVIAGYIKTDGKLYYRNYCTQLDGTVTWENERQVVEFTGTAVNLNMFITNDYRMGFVVEDNTGKIHWIITERNWAGMAIAPERIIAKPYEIKLDLIELDNVKGYEDIHIQANPYSIDFDLRYAGTDNEFIEIYNEPITLINESDEEYQDWGKVLIFKTQNKLYNLDKSDFEIVDSSNKSYFADTIEEIGDCLYKLSYTGMNNFNNVDQAGTLKFKGLITTNGVNVLYDIFEKVFYPLNLVPTAVPIPEVAEVWNE